MNKIYFKNVPNIGSLYLEKILFSFENTPIIFVCNDNDRQRFLCICDDIIDEESWIITCISDTTLLKILNDESTILSVFENKEVIIANKSSFDAEIQYDIENYNNIDSEELPSNDQYLEMKADLSDYINTVNNRIFHESKSFLFYSTDNTQYSLDFKYSLTTMADHSSNANDEYFKKRLEVYYQYYLQLKYEKEESNDSNELNENTNISFAA